MRLPAANASAIGLLRVLLAASLLVPIALFVAITWLNYRSTVADAERDLQRISAVASENAEKVFDSEAQLADRVNDLVINLDPQSVQALEGPLHKSLNDLVARLPHVASVMIASKSGRPLVSAEVYPVPGTIDLHGRDYFDAVVGGAQMPFVSSMQIGAVLRRQFFGLARPWTSLDGLLRGVIDVAVSPDYFSDFYGTLINEGPGSASGKAVSLIRANGWILLRYPAIIQPAVAAPTSFLHAVGAAPNNGIYTSNSLINPDHPPRLYSYRKVRGYPLYVVAGRSWSALLTDWRWTVLDHLLFGIPATLVLFAVTWTALSRTRREEQALRRSNLEIRRREAAEEALLRAQRLEAVGQMTGGVAHDFNNLLTVIAGNAALIDRRANDPTMTRRLAANIALAAQRGSDITQHLLAFAGRQTIRPEIIDLNARLAAFKPLLDRAASESVRLTFELAPALHQVRVDRGQFEVAILNLVGNARDAMPEGGQITITTRNREPGPQAGQSGIATVQTVWITVTDTGLGMDRETLAKAFEPFFTTKGVGKGTGLGLSQVYGFARQAGGEARISSNPGMGTTIEIVLPAAPDPAPAEMPRQADQMPGNGPSEGELPDGQLPVQAFPVGEPPTQVVPTTLEEPNGTVVLVVEDELNVLEMAVLTLKDLGYVTVTATNAKAALDQLRDADRVDVLFTDVVMPGGMNGLQLTTEVRRQRPDIKVLLTSGYTGLCGSLPDGLSLLPKPYDRQQLSAGIEAVLQQ